MADPTPVPPAVPVVSPGAQTSEFWLTKVLVFFGMAVTVLGTLVEVIQGLIEALSKVQPGTTGPALWVAIIGALVAVITSAIYKTGRVSLKKAALLSLTPDDAQKALEGA